MTYLRKLFAQKTITQPINNDMCVYEKVASILIIILSEYATMRTGLPSPMPRRTAYLHTCDAPPNLFLFFICVSLFCDNKRRLKSHPPPHPLLARNSLCRVPIYGPNRFVSISVQYLSFSFGSLTSVAKNENLKKTTAHG